MLLGCDWGLREFHNDGERFLGLHDNGPEGRWEIELLR
jgi:hypothetical protein